MENNLHRVLGLDVHPRELAGHHCWLVAVKNSDTHGARHCCYRLFAEGKTEAQKGSHWAQLA